MIKNTILLILFLCIAINAQSQEKVDVDTIVVEKAARKMYLMGGNEVIKEYDVSLGSNPIGHKQKEGDRKTPEGTYKISGRNPNSSFHLSLRISYPNEQDILLAKEKSESAGSDIMIHGLPNKLPFLGGIHLWSDWTQGCIAVTNSEIEEIWELVGDGTKITINP